MREIYFSTAQVARKLNVSQMTLFRWLRDRQIPEPRRLLIGHDGRAWTQYDIHQLRQYKAKHYAKKRS